MTLTLADIIESWLEEKSYDSIYIVNRDIFHHHILMFKPKIISFQHTQQHFIATIKDDNIMWWNNIFDAYPYNWPRNWGPVIKPLHATSSKFFDELDEVLAMLRLRYFRHDNSFIYTKKMV